MSPVDASNCEEFVLAQVAEIVGRTDVTPDDNFLELGGDSLRAILLATAVEERFGVTIELEQIFDARSLGDLGSLIGVAIGAPSVPPAT
jgi:acyl carrier protein